MIKSRFARLDGHMQEVAKVAFSALLIRILGTLLGFAVSVLVTRLLGAEGAGVYFLALSVATIFATIGRVGFDNTIVRFIASHASENEWDTVRFVYKTALKVVAFATLVASIAMFLGADWMANALFGKPFMELPLRLAAGAVLPLSFAMIHAASLRGLKKIKATQWIKTVFISLGSIVLLYPLVQLWGANGAVVAYVISVSMTALAAWILWRKAWQKIAKPVAGPGEALSLKPLFLSSWPLYGIALLGLVMNQTATIFLGVWGSTEDVGIYNVANRVASLLLFPLMAMTSILAPKFAAMYRQRDMEGLKRLANNSSKLLTLFAVPAALLMALCSEWILSMFGPRFTEGAIVLNILLIGVVVNTSAGAVADLLTMSGHEAVVRNTAVISAFVMLGVCFLLIPLIGMLGAAIATSTGIVILNISLSVMVRHYLGFWPMRMRFGSLR